MQSQPRSVFKNVLFDKLPHEQRTADVDIKRSNNAALRDFHAGVDEGVSRRQYVRRNTLLFIAE